MAHPEDHPGQEATPEMAPTPGTADTMRAHTMHAMLFEGVGQPLRAARIPVPSPAPGQLLLRVKACGVCRTDLHLLDGEVTIDQPPRVLGHQIVATVLDRGPAGLTQGQAELIQEPVGLPQEPAGGLAQESTGLGQESARLAQESAGLTQGQTKTDAPRARARVRAGTSKIEAHAPHIKAHAPHIGDRVGVPWLGWTCGECEYCRAGRENLCPNARFTGRDIDGGMAQYTVADARFCFPIPEDYPDDQAAPLLCAGLIGYRALRMCGDARRLGLYGFGAAAHILVQVARHQGREVFAFTRPGDEQAQRFARELGAVWAGPSGQLPPQELDAAIIFAPDGALVPEALRAVAPGGTVVCGGIHMSDIPSFPYADLWRERTIRSVANLTRVDATEFLALAPQAPVRTHVSTYPLAAANEALADLRAGRFTGAAVLVP